MDDELVESQKPRRNVPKNHFQKELQKKLKERKHRGLTVDISDSDDHSSSIDMDFKETHPERPSASKRRQRQYSDLNQGLGTQTMRTKDLSLLNHSLSDDDDDAEIIAANLGKINSRESLQSAGLKTPSPKQESKYLRKAARKKEAEIVDPVFGRIKDTPVKDGKRSPKDGSTKHFLSEDVDRQWQPPRYRNMSPRHADQSRGSHGDSSIDSSLDAVSESPREKVTPRNQHRNDTMSSDKPKPHVRSKVGKRETPPLVEQRSRSPSYYKEAEGGMRRTPTFDTKRTTPTHDMKSTTPTHDMKRTTPTHDMKRTTPTHDMKRTTPTHDMKRTTPTHDMKSTTPTVDIFGQSRSAAVQEVEKYIEERKDIENKGRKTPNSRAQTPESKREIGSRDKTSDKVSSVTFAMDDRKTPTERKTPTHSTGRKSPLDKRSSEKEVEYASKESSLLDFLMDDNTARKPKPQERGRRHRGKENLDIIDDIFENTRKEDYIEGHKSPKTADRKTPEHVRKSPVTPDKQGDMLHTMPRQQKAEDTSSLCDDIPLDPNGNLANQLNRSLNQTSERALADNVIEIVAMTQTMKYIEPAKKIRPRTASAKVQHRPKPRYGVLSGDTTKSLQERQFSSTGDIRDAIYEEWYKEHLVSARQRKKEEEKMANEEKEKKTKDAENKRSEAEASYKAWMELKKRALLEEHKNKEKEQKMIKEKEEQEKKDRKDNSQKLFETWRTKKDDVTKKEMLTKLREAKKVEEEKKQKKIEMMKERESAHKSWLNKKEHQHVVEVKEKKKDKKEKTNMDKNVKEELKKKEMSADNLYFEWLEKRKSKQN